MSGTASISGIISGLSTDDIITKMLDYARKPETLLKTEKITAQQKLTAWQDINTRVLALKTKCDSIAVSNAFEAKQAESSDTDIATVSASEDAMPGTYYMKVTSRAQCHQLSSQSFSATDANIGTGTASISLANGDSFDVDINTNNNTLTGLRDAINNSKDNKGVQAVIVNTGTSSNEYKLLLTSTNSGSENAMTVNTSGLSGGTAPLINNEVQAATDAVVELGEGTGKITVTKSSNSITDLIPGVTLNIGNPDSSKTIRVNVTRDTSAISSSINSFVSQYNDLIDAVNTQFDFDPETKESGTLFGDYQLQSIQIDITNAVNSVVSGVSAKFSALSSVGITLDTSNHLVVDSSKLSTALNDNADDVSKLFASDMASDSSYVTYISSTGDTKPSGATGWNLNVTQAATRSQVTAGAAFGNLIDGKLSADETLTINSIKITLKKDTTLADAVKEINSHSTETNVTALATDQSGGGTGSYLSLRTIQYGSKYDLATYSTMSNASDGTSGFGSTPVSAAKPAGEGNKGQGAVGLDIAGTINGEAATGAGQVLTANPSNPSSSVKGLVLMVTSPTAMTSNVTFTKGIGTALRDLLVNMTSTKGIFTTTEDTINTNISDYDKSIADMETKITAQSDKLYTQFNAMESQLAKLQQQGSYIGAMIGSSSSSSGSKSS